MQGERGAVSGRDTGGEDRLPGENDGVELPVDGVLDLHFFLPRDADDLLPRYLEECRKRGILGVRIIHGKGTGALRRKVHSILRRIPWVTSFGTAGESGGGWGSTVATLAPSSSGDDPSP